MTSPSRVLAARAATRDLKKAKSTPLEKLREFLETGGMRSKTGPRSFADFERELHERMMEAERDVVAGEMARLDVDVDAVVIAGKVHRRVLRQSQTYMTSAGEVVVERTLYKEDTARRAARRCRSATRKGTCSARSRWRAHRRYFFDSLKTAPVAQEALDLITELYLVEHDARERRFSKSSRGRLRHLASSCSSTPSTSRATLASVSRAKLRLPNACIEDIDFAPKRELDRAAVRQTLRPNHPKTSLRSDSAITMMRSGDHDGRNPQSASLLELPGFEKRIEEPVEAYRPIARATRALLWGAASL
jgi:hypothetical protein